MSGDTLWLSPIKTNTKSSTPVTKNQPNIPITDTLKILAYKINHRNKWRSYIAKLNADLLKPLGKALPAFKDDLYSLIDLLLPNLASEPNRTSSS